MKKHCEFNRPMWPQGSPYLPANTSPIPDGFDWDLWLGPSLTRPYSSTLTYTVCYTQIT
jgi:hypothetical protein